MVLELHIWGPAFGLPSIEPECIATVAYCQQVLPQEQWKLIADYELTVGSGQTLPVLIDDGVTTAVGYEDIVAYLRNYPGIAGDLDAGLASHQQTDRIAFTSFLQSTGTPLIDLSLYVSAENYNTITSAAYTQILPWWANYSVPPQRRNLARTRTAHMGLSSLDIDTTADDDIAPGRGTASSDYEAAKRAAGIPTESQPNTLHMGRGKGLGGFLGTPVYAARFRLDALSNELLEPLSDLLGKKEYLFGGNEPSSLDCLAFGYLALLYFPEVPQAWLRETIQAKFLNLGAYLRRLRERFFSSEQINSTDVWSISTGAATGKENGILPWGPRNIDVATRTSLGTRELIGNMPLLSLLSGRSAITHVSSTRANVKSALPSPFFMNTLYGITATIAVGLATLVVHHRRSPRDGPLIFWALRPNGGPGEAGNILSILAQQLPAAGGYSQF